MIIELLVLLNLILYIGILVFLWKFRMLIVFFFRIKRIIKVMSDLNELSNLLENSENSDVLQPEIDKRAFLLEKILNGVSISKSAKTAWTEERLEKASDKVINKLYDQYQNPPSIKVNKAEALDLGKPICPVVIEMYAEGLKAIIKNTPYIGDKYTINVEKLTGKIASNQSFCNNLAIKIGSKMIEQIGDNSPMHMGVSLATMTWGCIENVRKKSENNESENKQDD